MKWIYFKKQQPKEGQKILWVRASYPAFYWMGKYKADHAKYSDTDKIEWWLPLPEREPWKREEND